MVSTTELETPWYAAVMVATPALLPVATPREPATLLTVARTPLEDDHDASSVRSCVVLSVYLPVAVNACVVPFAMVGVAGVSSIETSVAVVTVNWVTAETPLSVAEMVTTPSVAPCANPSVAAELLMVATAGFEEFQATDVVRGCVLASV
jgi:hypothetical protein